MSSEPQDLTISCCHLADKKIWINVSVVHAQLCYFSLFNHSLICGIAVVIVVLIL